MMTATAVVKVRRYLAPAVAALLVLEVLILLPGVRCGNAARANDVFDCEGITPVLDDEIIAELVRDDLVKPVDIQTPPGDTERLFIVEQRGQILILDVESGSLRPGSFLDIVPKVDDGGEKGLLGLAFHPDYASNGIFFLNYTRTGGQTGLETVISSFKVSSSNPDRAETAETVLLTFSQPFSNHNGGQVAFGPADGYLYISTGDGGSAGDPGNRAQNPLSYLGKMLRIDVDSDAPYGIPSSNPFPDTQDVLPELWAWGLRNPWRFAFDPETADMVIADVGQNNWEEINFQPASSTGAINYEWKVREGNHGFSATAYGPGTRVAPIFEYPHSGGAITGCSITGGVVYRGCRMPALHGRYFFADHCSNWIRSFRIEDGKPVDTRDHTAALNANLGNDRIDDISSFGADGRGDIYICDLRNSRIGEASAKLYRIVPKNPPVPQVDFVRGNSNGDNMVDLTDVVFTLGHLFRGIPPSVDCEDALDSNDDGELDISDAVFELIALFAGGAPIPAPYPDCGPDTTADDLSCETAPCG
ncbi:MAG TPA: PQQ-dependent sugar dehydrogenase [Planctomycetota bacterium]|nr:PQQ-dependent sugar dehydrogenase [Planctomycetota bacterium]